MFLWGMSSAPAKKFTVPSDERYLVQYSATMPFACDQLVARVLLVDDTIYYTITTNTEEALRYACYYASMYAALGQASDRWRWWIETESDDLKAFFMSCTPPKGLIYPQQIKLFKAVQKTEGEFDAILKYEEQQLN
jgi:hypothetical protein